MSSFAIRLFKKVHQLPLKFVVPAVWFCVWGILYGIVFFVDQPVKFSYAGGNCTRYPLLFPDTQRVSPRAGYDVYATGRVKIGSISLASSSLCFVPSKAPHEGLAKVNMSPYGTWLARKSFALGIPPPLKVSAKSLDKPVPVTKNITVGIDGIDKIFSYQLTIDGKKLPCKPGERKIICDVQSLGLGQGKAYDMEVSRWFHEKKIQTVVQKQITTLSAVRIADSSIKGDETVFSKPKTIDIVADKKLTKATAKLYRLNGDQKTEVQTTVEITETGLRVVAAEDLPRASDYTLAVSDIEAVDGSSLDQAYNLPFKLSGGPKVTGINIGRTGVALGVTAVITFDQPLSDKQDVGALVSLGGGAKLAGRQGNQLLVTLRDVPKCGDFSIRISGDVQSNYDIGGNSAWQFAGRMICYSVSTIGYSSQGRAINAYYFGGGQRIVLYSAAIHGNELGTRRLLQQWIQDLDANARTIPADKTIVVVPQINPDGAAVGSRLNARNVDLNRNFATGDWRSDVTDVNNRPFPGGGGPSPMSEPETQAIAGLVRQLHPVLVLSYHSIGGVVAANLAGGSGALAATYAQLSGYGNATGQTSETFDYSVSGTADDWYAEALGVASLLVELGSHSSPQFDRNQKAMWAMVNM